MNLNLPEELQQFIQGQLDAGYYASAEEVVIAAIWQMKIEENPHDELEELRAELTADSGKFDRDKAVEFTAESVIAECRAKWDASKKAG